MSKIIKLDHIDRVALARALKTSRNVIDQVACGARKVSPLRALDIERLTAGKVTAADLRPDIFGPMAHKKKKNGKVA